MEQKKTEVQTINWTQQSKELLTAVNRQLITQGINLKPREISTILETSKSVKAHTTEAQVLLIDVAAVYYGVNPEKLATNLIKGAVIHLVENYNGITLADMATAYKRKVIEKKKGVGITIGEILEPVSEWWKVKTVAIEAKKNIERQQQQRVESEAKQIEWIQHCRSTYEKALEVGEWSGGVFRAATVAKFIEIELTDEEKIEMKEQAARIAKSSKIMGVDSHYFGVTSDRIYKDLLVKEAVKRKIKL